MKKPQRTWVEISKSALQSNIKELNRVIPKDTEFVAIIKGNAYGHGLLETAGILSKMKEVDRFAVFTTEEGMRLRKSGITQPIIILKNISKEEVKDVEKYRLEACVSSLPALRMLLKAATKKSAIHICVDTGLGRDGFSLEESEKVIALLHGTKKITLAGLFTHFSGAESREFDSYTVTQLSKLHEWRRRFADVGMHPKLHSSATSGAFLGPDFHLSMVRFGIGIYGLWPSEETQALNRNGVRLIPVLSWRAQVSEVKMLPKGSFVAYDCTYKTKADSVLAIIPVGYFDGYSRALSGKSAVLVKGKRAPVVGRVMMNMFVVDVTHIPGVKEGDTATLIGRDGGEEMGISVEEIADYRSTINYEIVTRINPEIPRIIAK